MIKQIFSSAFILCLLLPVFASAQLTSENYTVTGSAIAPGGVSLDGSSASNDADLEAGGLYQLNTVTPPPPSSSGSGSGGSRVREVAATPTVSDLTLLIGPVRVMQGGAVLLAITVSDRTGQPINQVDRTVTIAVAGANSQNLTATNVAPGLYVAEYTADNTGLDQVTAMVNGVSVTRDTYGTSDGTLLVTISEPVPAVVLPTEVIPELPALDSGSARPSVQIVSGITAACNRAFTWEERGAVSISRQIEDGASEQLVSLSGRMQWYVDTEVIGVGTVRYDFMFANQMSGSVTFTTDDFAGCRTDAAAVVQLDVDGDQAAEQFVDGIYQDLDGSTVPLAITAYGLVLDTNGDQIADTFWNPSVGTAAIITAEDRLFVIDSGVSPTQSYEPRVQGTYYVVLSPGEGSLSRPEPITEILNPLNDIATEEPGTHFTLPFENGLITAGFLTGLISILYGLERIPFSVTNLSYFFAHGWAHFFALFAFWRKRREWGTVYDSVTKAPIDPAIIELYDEAGVQQASAITDLDGRYGFLVPSGIYTMLVKKTHYLFPSKRISSRMEDTIYSNLYLGGPLEVNAAVVYDVPMDPTVFDWNQYEKMRTKQTRFIHRFDPLLARFVQVVFYLGLAAVAWQWYSVQDWGTATVFVVYLVLLFLRHTRGKPVLYGTLMKDRQPLSFALVHVMRNGMKIMHKVSDVYGRYVAILAPGTYVVRIEERIDADTFRIVFEGEVEAKKGIINQNFKL